MGKSKDQYKENISNKFVRIANKFSIKNGFSIEQKQVEEIFTKLYLYEPKNKGKELAKDIASDIPNLKKTPKLKYFNEMFDNTMAYEIKEIIRLRQRFGDKKREGDKNKKGKKGDKNKKSKKNGTETKFEFKSFIDFYDWYIAQYDDQDGKCFYCDTKESAIEMLSKISKRSVTRGHHLEVERKNTSKANNKYNTDNCVLACYICNNAKSDVFTEKEFEPIATAIGKAIKSIIEKKK